MNRRNFLQCLGAFAAAAFIPVCSERIIRAPAWAKEVTVYRAGVPLVAGNYAFTAYAGDLGIYVGGFKATGGELLFEIPVTTGAHPLDNPRIKLGGIYVNYPDPIIDLHEDGRSVGDFTDQRTRDNLLRGDAVVKA